MSKGEEQILKVLAQHTKALAELSRMAREIAELEQRIFSRCVEAE